MTIRRLMRSDESPIVYLSALSFESAVIWCGHFRVEE